jgi:hypothetical protein
VELHVVWVESETTVRDAHLALRVVALLALDRGMRPALVAASLRVTRSRSRRRTRCHRLGRALDVRAEVARVPRLALRAMGLFSSFMRETAEIAYQWDVPFVLDDARFRAAFGQEPTPIDEAVAATAAWARGRFAFRAAA